MVSRCARRPREAGFTLVELMVTVVIAGLVAASTYVFFAGQRRVYETQMRVLNVQQNLWASMEAMSRYIRLAGMGTIGCVLRDPDFNPVTEVDGPLLGDPPPIGNTPPQTGLRVFSSTAVPGGAYGTAGNAFRLAPLWIRNNANAAGNDEITIAFGGGAFGNYFDSTLQPPGVNQGTSAVLIPAGDENAYRVNELILLLDDTSPVNTHRGCTLLQITGIVPGVPNFELQHAATSTWNPGGDPAGFIRPGGYAANTAGVRNFGQLFWLRFWIRVLTPPPGGVAIPALMMTQLAGTQTSQTEQVLAEGIEDMQIAYACDLTSSLGTGPPDGRFNEGTTDAEKTTDEWVYNVANDTIPATTNRWYHCNRPEAIRLTLVARSTEEETDVNVTDKSSWVWRRPAAEDHAQGDPDRFRRRTATTIIYPRNPGVIYPRNQE